MTTDTVGLRPKGVVLRHHLGKEILRNFTKCYLGGKLFHYLSVLDDPPELVHDGLVDVGLLSDHGVILKTWKLLLVKKFLVPASAAHLVVAVIGIAKLAVRAKLELQKLMAKLSLVADIIAEVEVVTHIFFNSGTIFSALLLNFYKKKPYCSEEGLSQTSK